VNYLANPIVTDDVDRILRQDLPWSEFNGSTVLITGAAGFLPAYLVETLARLNALGASIRIVGLVRRTEHAQARLGHLKELGVELMTQDIAQPLRADIPQADFIIHAASQASPRFYGIDPVGTLEANSSGTQHLLRHAYLSSCRAFLFFSSGEVYGMPIDDSRRLREVDFGYLDPATVRACYAESKRLGETMCVSWHHQYGVPSRIVRPFHTYGPGMALDDGRVFADFVADAVIGRDIVVKSDGAALRSFCYIADATVGFLTVLLKGQNAQAYNVANPEAEISIRDLAFTMAKLFPDRGIGVRFDIPPNTNSYLQSPVIRSCPSIEKIVQLGWMPSTGITEGFRRTVQSFL
jgi:UDP-glucuronate decarboxylase